MTDVSHETMVSQVNAAVLAERERCAKIAESWWERTESWGTEHNQSVRRRCCRAIAYAIHQGEQNR
jgi:hypothetical protein